MKNYTNDSVEEIEKFQVIFQKIYCFFFYFHFLFQKSIPTLQNLYGTYLLNRKEQPPTKEEKFNLDKYPFQIQQVIIHFLISLKQVLGNKMILYFPKPILKKIVAEFYLSSFHFLTPFDDFDQFFSNDIPSDTNILRGIFSYGFEKPSKVQSYILDPLFKGLFLVCY